MKPDFYGVYKRERIGKRELRGKKDGVYFQVVSEPGITKEEFSAIQDIILSNMKEKQRNMNELAREISEKLMHETYCIRIYGFRGGKDWLIELMN